MDFLTELRLAGKMEDDPLMVRAAAEIERLRARGDPMEYDLLLLRVEHQDAKIERLRAALTFYADPYTYTDEAWRASDGDAETSLCIEFDKGWRARKALESARQP